MKAGNGEVEVFVRIRPTANFARDLIECLPDGQTLNIYQRKVGRKPHHSRQSQLNSQSFKVKGILQDVSQEWVYARVCQRVVLEALDGYNGTVMCFGQTGAGKTYTMTGSTESYKQRGIIPRALQNVFHEMERRTEYSISVHLSYLEIYNETLVDLLSSLQRSPHLSPQSMMIMEEPGGGVFVRGLSLQPVHSEEEALNVFFEGEMNRIIGSNALNRNSSRSHCIFTVHIESHLRTLSDVKYVTSKLNLVDLAGSERPGKTQSEGQLLKEAMYINKSLSFLEQTVLAIADCHRDHIPFRQSKLTYTLKDSLGGNCNTVLVANIYGDAAHIDETLSTLRFASRMKCVQTEPTVNEHVDQAVQIKKLQREIQVLREELSSLNKLADRPHITYAPLSEAQMADIHSQVHRYLDGSLKEIDIRSVRQVQAVFAQFKLLHEQEKEKQCQSYNLLKEQIANMTAVKEGDTRGSHEDSEAAQTQENSHRPSSKKAKNKKLKDRCSQSKRQVSRRHLESASKSRLNTAQTPETEEEADAGSQDSHDSQTPVDEPTQPKCPPPKAEAFEDFKLKEGSEINHILKENKAILLERQSLMRQLTEEVNTVKRHIDGTMTTIQQHKDLSRGRGETVPQDPDATLMMQLRVLKAQYRQKYEALRDIKAEVNYCQHLVDQCRLRLLSEFENWYKKLFSLPEEEELTMDKNVSQVLHSPSAESFHSARYRVLKRRSARASSMTPVQMNSSSGSRPRLPSITAVIPVT
ncbi:kinesin-like protein KIF9 [Sphaeramia orbicularis]|uniref:kinesin-like protein KIF9 n=1 Tax=Sphaeramia orbicularis TaxID=375764 RepID=UPI00117F3FD2|nr:kinesin-like protein KIF9 [Sphaeramia orbicularis]